MLDSNKYNEFLIEECLRNSQINNTTPDEEFINYMNSLFEYHQMIFGLNEVYVDLKGKHNSNIHIDGWTYDEADQSFVLINTKFFNVIPESNFTKEDADAKVKEMTEFVENTLDGYLLETESDDNNFTAMEPVKALYDQYNDTEKILNRVKLLVIVNCQSSKGLLKKYTKEIELENKKKIQCDISIIDIEDICSLDVHNKEKSDRVTDVASYMKGGVKFLEVNPDEINKQYKVYLCAVTGDFLADIYKKYGSELLEGNVRSFLSPNGKVNRSIRRTIEEKPTYFFAYNNGIAATAKAVEIKNGRITKITNLQIINGGQTTASLSFARFNDKKKILDLSKITVFMKLTLLNNDLEEVRKNTQDIITNISRFSNTQNSVSDADFFSNSKYHVLMHIFAKKTEVPDINDIGFSTFWWYENKRGSYKRQCVFSDKAEGKRFKRIFPKNQCINKTELAKYLMVFEKKPFETCRGAQFAMKEFGKFITSKYSTDEKIKELITERYVKECISKAIVYRKIDSLIQKQSWYIPGVKAYTVNYTISKLVDLVDQYSAENEFNYTIDYNKIWETQDTYDSLDKMALNIAEKVQTILVDNPNGIEFGRKKECWDSVKQIEIELSDLFKDDLITTEQTDKSRDDEHKKFMDKTKERDFVFVIRKRGSFWSKVLKEVKERNIQIGDKEKDILIRASGLTDNRGLLSSQTNLRVLTQNEAHRLVKWLKSRIENSDFTRDYLKVKKEN